MDITRGVEHTLSTIEGLARPLGLLATVKEAPTPGRGPAVDTWAMIEQQETAPPTDSAPTRQRSQEEILAKTICWVQCLLSNKKAGKGRQRWVGKTLRPSLAPSRRLGSLLRLRLPSAPGGTSSPVAMKQPSLQCDHGPLDPSARLRGPSFGHYDHHVVHHVCGGDMLPQYGERRMVS